MYALQYVQVATYVHVGTQGSQKGTSDLLELKQ